jgi:DNA-binding LacI/PurR family transcriptional regulator
MPGAEMAVKDVKLPKYQEVRSWLLEVLSTRGFQKGERFYSENWVAKEFGIAPMTVRRAFSLLEDEKYLRRVQGAGTFVMKLPPHPTKMQVVTHCTIGVLINHLEELDNLRFGALMTEAYRWIGEKNYMLNMAVDDAKKLINAKVDGIMTFGVPDKKTERILKNSGLPVACLGRWSKGKFPCVYQTEDAITKIYQKLLDHGRKRIAVLNFGVSHKYRIQNYQRSLSHLKNSADCNKFEFVCGRENEVIKVTEELLSRPKDKQPDALYVISWQSITAILQAVAYCGFKIPDDLGLVCSGGDLLSLSTDPPISMIRAYSKKGVMELTKMIFNMIKDKNYRGEEIQIGTSLTGDWTL